MPNYAAAVNAMAVTATAIRMTGDDTFSEESFIQCFKSGFSLESAKSDLKSLGPNPAMPVRVRLRAPDQRVTRRALKSRKPRTQHELSLSDGPRGCIAVAFQCSQRR